MDTGLIYQAEIYLPGRFYEQEKQSIMLLAFLNGDRTGHYFDVHDPDGYVSKTPVWQVHETGKQISGGFRHRIGFPEGTDGEILGECFSNYGSKSNGKSEMAFGEGSATVCFQICFKCVSFFTGGECHGCFNAPRFEF